MNRFTRALAALIAIMPLGSGASRGQDLAVLSPEAPTSGLSASTAGQALPMVVRQGEDLSTTPQRISIPDVVTPSAHEDGRRGRVIGKAGTGFFVASDGTLLTAAHVVTGCAHVQILSPFIARDRAAVIATDQNSDIAVLRASVARPPAVLRVAAASPVSDRLVVLGYPGSAGVTVADATWAVMQNQKFPAGTGSLGNPRELLWISAPDVTHGYSGGPMFDPGLGAVVGIVKGEVEVGYLRLVRDMPAAGVAIGPGVEPMAEVLRREAPYVAISAAASPVPDTEDTLRRATVHVLCWR